jgi:hypothetical protein
MVAMLSFSEDDAGYVDQLADFVAIPSVSRDASPETMRRAAGWLVDQLQFAGGRMVETAGNPVVLAELAGPPGAPTILVYGHYDGEHLINRRAKQIIIGAFDDGAVGRRTDVDRKSTRLNSSHP